MHASTTYAIYWVPSGFSVDANYESLINRYLTDVGVDSGRSTNVYSAATQYYDAAGPIVYQSSFAGGYVDTHAFPGSGCNVGHGVVCLTDQQIQDELQRVLTSNGWHGSTTTMFFVMTPDGVASCFDGSGRECTTNTYCAYHNSFTDSTGEPVIYANQPYDATISGCESGSSPNGDDADSTINTMSHEHNEAVTDPFGDAWWNFASGQENGDNCAWVFGSSLGGTPGVDEYNQIINGHHYWLQEEWSNDGSDCVQHYLGIPVNVGAPTVSGPTGVGQVLSATQGSWTQSPTSYLYQWVRCTTAEVNSCSAFPDATAATYRLTSADVGRTLRVGVYAQNAAGTSPIAFSAPTAVVVTLPAASSQPVVSGLPIVGRTLSTTSGAWNTTASFAYQWERCAANSTGCIAIPGAAAATYTLGGADLGHTLRAVVSATNVAGAATSSSAATGLIIAVPQSTKTPRISGKVKVGRSLSASQGSWNGFPDVYRYQWLRCTGSGAKCTRIKKATHAKYRLTKRDAGHRLRVRVTAANLAGSVAATSLASKRVPHVQRHH